MNIVIVSGSIRQGRGTPQVAEWVKATAEKLETDAEFTLVDLLELHLPLFDESESPQANPDRTVGPVVGKWLDILENADGIIFVTPEYNHGIPGALKNAIDLIDNQIVHKPVAIVSHGVMGGARSNEQLRLVVNSTLGGLPLPESVTLNAAPVSRPVFTDNHELLEEYSHAQRPLDKQLRAMVKIAAALKQTRES